METNHHLYCQGSGGRFLNNVSNIHLSFVSMQQGMTIDDARSLLVECVETLLQKINDDNQIKPYLSHYPYTVEGITLMLSYESFPNTQSDNRLYPTVDFIFVDDSIVYYNRLNLSSQNYVTLLQEPYFLAHDKAILKNRFEEITKQTNIDKNVICNKIKQPSQSLLKKLKSFLTNKKL